MLIIYPNRLLCDIKVFSSSVGFAATFSAGEGFLCICKFTSAVF